MAPVSEALLVAKMENLVDVAHCMAIVARPLLSEYDGVISLDLAHGLLAVLNLRDVKADATLQVQSRSHLPRVESLSWVNPPKHPLQAQLPKMGHVVQAMGILCVETGHKEAVVLYMGYAS